MHRPKSYLIALGALSTSLLGTGVAEVPDVSSRQTPVKLPTFALSPEPKVNSTRDLVTERHIRQQHQARRK